MATTTNYSWTTPDDTALVKDGAAAIRSLGTAIDTTVFNNASAGIAKTIVDAKGDIIAATAADTVARLAVGANDTVLTADSSTATGLKWATAAAGGLTLISTTSLTGGTVNLTSIPGTYKHLQLIITEAYAAADTDVLLRLNNDSGATSYADARIRNRSAILSGLAGTSLSAIRIGTIRGTTTAADRYSIVLDIPRYTDTGQNAIVNFEGRIEADSPGSGIGAGYYKNRTAAITEINLICDGTTFSAGTAYLYGVS
jgi:hypothetical protein